jgi:hypothetical protein
MTQDKLRECARRQNRAVSLFCIVQCWLNGWDGIIIKRDFFESFFKLQNFKNIRLEWMSTDLKEFFPYQEPKELSSYYFNSIKSIKISRIPFDQNPHIGEFKIWEHPNNDYLNKYLEGYLSLFKDYSNYDDRLLAFFLSWLSQEQISHQLMPIL